MFFEEAGDAGGGEFAFTMSVCFTYLNNTWSPVPPPLYLPSTAVPNNRSIVLPEIKTSTIVAVENNASC